MTTILEAALELQAALILFHSPDDGEVETSFDPAMLDQSIVPPSVTAGNFAKYE